MKNNVKGSLCLMTTVLIWGSAFIAQSVGMDRIGPFTFQTFRSALAVIFLFPMAILLDCRKCSLRQSMEKWKDPKLWKAGLICGVALFCGSSLQQIALLYTDAGKAGFITAMYIVLVPPKTAIFSVILAVVGLYLLSCVGVTEVNKGDLLLMVCALGFAVQILCVDHFGGNLDGFRMNCVQVLTVLVLSAVFMLATETVNMADVTASMGSIAYTGILSTGIAYSLQILGQKEMDPTPAAIIMSMESVVAVLCGALILKETMNGWEISGCVLMFAAVMLSQLPERKKA